jgi:Glycosyltransferase Family 4
MRRVLIVSPSFVPVNSADMQRVRMSLAHFREFGWEPIVLTVHPDYVEGVKDPVLDYSLPPDVQIFRVRALPIRWTRKFGLGSLGLRAFPFLHREGRRLIRTLGVNLVYFSTTMFPAMALGPIWKKEFGVPFIPDMQDPWVSDYQEGRSRKELPPKFWFMNRVHRILEPWTMKEADGLIAVSAGYIETLCRRYPWLKSKPAAVLPFAAAESDFEILQAHPQPNRFFRSGEDASYHGVYVGRGGHDMAPALRIIFAALRRGLEEKPDLFSRVRLHFIGTDYAPDRRSRKTIEPIAVEFGVGEYVEESPQRVPYFEALQLLRDADFQIVPGSDDPQYTASKIFPYILARKPLLCVFQQSSNVCDTLERLQAGTVVKFSPELPSEAFCQELYRAWSQLLSGLPYVPATNWAAFESMGAREGTRQQCRIFDQVLGASGQTDIAHDAGLLLSSGPEQF